MNKNKYITLLEKEIGRRIKIERTLSRRLIDYVDTCFDLQLEVRMKNDLATRLFILGLLLGGLLVECLVLLSLLQ